MKSYVQEEREWFDKALDEAPIPEHKQGSSLLTMLAEEKLSNLRRHNSIRWKKSAKFRFLDQTFSYFAVDIDGFPVFVVEFSFHSDPVVSVTHVKGDFKTNKKPVFLFHYLKQL